MDVRTQFRDIKETYNSSVNNVLLGDTQTRTILSIIPRGSEVEFNADWIAGSHDPMIGESRITWETIEISYELKGNVQWDYEELMREFRRGQQIIIEDGLGVITNINNHYKRDYHLTEVGGLEWINSISAIIRFTISCGNPYKDITVRQDGVSVLNLPIVREPTTSYRIRLLGAPPNASKEVKVEYVGSAIQRLTINLIEGPSNLEINGFDGVIGHSGGVARVSNPLPTNRPGIIPIKVGTTQIRVTTGTPTTMEAIVRSYAY